jgi:hypothetical protein
MMKKYKCQSCDKGLSECDGCKSKIRFNKEIFCLKGKMHYCHMKCMSFNERIVRCRATLSEEKRCSSLDKHRNQAYSMALKNNV